MSFVLDPLVYIPVLALIILFFILRNRRIQKNQEVALHLARLAEKGVNEVRYQWLDTCPGLIFCAVDPAEPPDTATVSEYRYTKMDLQADLPPEMAEFVAAFSYLHIMAGAKYVAKKLPGQFSFVSWLDMEHTTAWSLRRQ